MVEIQDVHCKGTPFWDPLENKGALEDLDQPQSATQILFYIIYTYTNGGNEGCTL